MIRHFWFFLLLVMLAQFPANNAKAGERVEEECVLYMTPGDSLMGLFGGDWLTVFTANRQTLYSVHGWLDPNNIPAGTRLAVPAGTYLTDHALARLERYAADRSAAEEAVMEAEALSREAGSSELSRDGLALLARAKNATGLDRYDYANLQDSLRFAKEATRLFNTDQSLSKMNVVMVQLKEEVRRDKEKANRRLREEALLRWLVSGIGALVGLGLLFWAMTARRRARIKMVDGWFVQHERLIKDCSTITSNH